MLGLGLGVEYIHHFDFAKDSFGFIGNISLDQLTFTQVANIFDTEIYHTPTNELLGVLVGINSPTQLVAPEVTGLGDN
jgi:hypothetical protein